MSDKPVPTPELLSEAKAVWLQYRKALDEYKRASDAVAAFAREKGISRSALNAESDLERWLIEASL